jgi:hypothetical protein
MQPVTNVHRTLRAAQWPEVQHRCTEDEGVEMKSLVQSLVSATTFVKGGGRKLSLEEQRLAT